MPKRKASSLRSDLFHACPAAVSSRSLQRILKACEDERCGGEDLRVCSLPDKTDLFGELYKVLQLQDKNGDWFDWTYVCPFSLLYSLTKTNESFSEMFKRAMERTHVPSPSHMWKLLFYCDEAVPGNPLSPDQGRKSWCFYYSWAELGQRELCSEWSWLTFGVLRSSEVEHVSGGMAAVFTACMNVFLGGSPNMRDHGFVVCLPTRQHLVIVCDFAAFVGDERAIKLCWDFKGSGGSHVCHECKNVLQLRKKGERIRVDGERVCDITTIDMGAFERADNEWWFRCLRKLRHVNEQGTAADLARTTQTLGINWNPKHVMIDPNLRSLVLPSSICWDWVHVWVVQGLWQMECALFVVRFGANNAHIIDDFFEQWTWPKHLHVQWRMRQLFSPSRMASFKTSQHFRCSGSDALAMYPVLRRFVVMCVQPELPRETDSLLAACACLDLLSTLSRGGCVTRATLDDATTTRARLFQLAYSPACVKPKHHYALHLARQLEKHAALYGTFVLERKHQAAKACGAFVPKRKFFEAAVARKLVNLHVQQLDCRPPIDDAVHFLTKVVEMEGCFAASGATYKGMRVAAGDFIVHSQGLLGRVLAVVSDTFYDDAHVYVEPWALQDRAKGCFVRQDGMAVLPFDNVERSCAFRLRDGGSRVFVA